MINELWLLLLPVAAVSGWWVAYRYFQDSDQPKNILFSRDYLKGLNFILNEEPDKALDVFIKMLEVDSETVETHLALGNLFRKRGEVQRAIRIHQNLIARPTLHRTHRTQALLALAIDYLQAGVFDRAEKLFLELISLKEHVTESLQFLLNIYEQEREWQKAIQTAQQLAKQAPEKTKPIIAQYYCELATIALEKQDLDLAKTHLKRALKEDPNCARASLMMATLENKTEHYSRAIHYLHYIQNQNPDFLSEAIHPLVEAFRALHKEKELIVYLKKILEDHPKVPIAMILSEQIKEWQGEKEATSFVADYVRRYPSIQGLACLVELYLPMTEGKSKDDLMILKGLIQQLLKNQSPYQCSQCGFSSQTLHWQCPTCRKWNTMKPSYAFNIIFPPESPTNSPR